MVEYTMPQIQGSIIKPIKPLSYEFWWMTGIEEVLLFEDGCLLYLPENEYQIWLFFDTLWCVSFSFTNCVETLFNRLIPLGKFNTDNVKWLANNYTVNGKINFSDRDLIVLSDTNPAVGNDGWTVSETAKKRWLICETDAPWNFRSMNPSENNKALYYSYKRDKKSEEKAQEFLKRFEIKTEWVSRDNLLEASKYGVIQVYVTAWYQRNGKYYNPTPGTTNHAVELAKKSEEKIFDTYDPFIKQLERNEDFHVWWLKINIIEKTMPTPTLKNNTLIMMVTGWGDIGLFLDWRIIKDDPAKILAVWLARSSKNDAFTGWLVKSLTEEQWKLFPHANLKWEIV